MIVIGHNHIRRVETFDGYEILAHRRPHAPHPIRLACKRSLDASG